MHRLWSLAGALMLFLSGATPLDETPITTAQRQAPALPDPSPKTATPPPKMPTSLTLGVAPYIEQSRLNDELAPMATYLSNALGLPVKLEITENYESVAEGLENDTFHVGELSAYNFVRLERRAPHIKPLASVVLHGGFASLWSYIFVHADSPYHSIEDLRGQDFAFVSPHSTTGFLYPMLYFQRLGIDPQAHFSSLRFAGDHQTIVDMVLRGKVAAGVSSSAVFNFAATEEDRANLRLLSKVGSGPPSVFVVNTRVVPASLLPKLTQALMELNTRSEHGRIVLETQSLGRNGFIAYDDSRYDEIRTMADALQDVSRALQSR